MIILWQESGLLYLTNVHNCIITSTALLPPSFNLIFHKTYLASSSAIRISFSPTEMSSLLNRSEDPSSLQAKWWWKNKAWLEIATNRVANATNVFSLRTKIPVKSPLWLPEFCMILMYNRALKVKINLLSCLAFIVEWLNRIKKAAFSHPSFTDFCPILNNIKNLTLSTSGTRSSFWNYTNWHAT